MTAAPGEGGAAPLSCGVWLVALVFVALELAVSARYGFHRDELYFVVAGRRPALGYVDQPPVAPLLTRITALLGTSPAAIRLLPALAGGLLVVAAGKLAAVLGGRGRAQAAAAIATAAAPVILGAAHLAGTTVYDMLAWSGLLLAVITAVLHGRPRLWLASGIVAGAGLEVKDLVLLLAAALVAGLLLSGPRRALAGRWPWLGAALALILWAPNLAWQAQNRWPALTMAGVLRAEHSSASDHVTVFIAQIVYAGVLAVPLAVSGAIWLWRRRDTRFLCIAFLLLLAYVVLIIPGRPYYDDGMLPLLFAAGAVAWESRLRASTPRLLAPALGTAVLLPLVLPILPVSVLHDIPGLHKINYDLGEQVGWPQLTAAVAATDRSLARDGQPPTSIFTANYGEAGALLVLGGSDLPPILSGHNSFWLWGPGAASDAVVLSVGAQQQLAPFFACRQVAVFHSPDGVANDEDGVQLAVCTRPRAPWPALWPRLRNYS